jgi:ribosomal protein L23
MDVGEVYISLGSDCSVSYQLRKLGLQCIGTFPFDWMKITKLDNLIGILDNDFVEFNRFDSYIIKSQSDRFDYFDGDNCNMKSSNKLIHKKYSFVLPHEYNENDIDILEFEKKYSRRIEKFRTIVRNKEIRKVFVRLGNTKEQKKEIILEATLNKYGCQNFRLQIINMDDYKKFSSQEEFNWHRDYIPWQDIL